MLSSTGHLSCKGKKQKTKNTLCTKCMCFEMPKKSFRPENYVTIEGAVSHNVFVYYQHLPIARYQVRFYANNYFE